MTIIIRVPNPSRENIVGATHLELIFFEETYPIEVVPVGGRLAGRVPFSVIRLFVFRPFGGFPIDPMIEDKGQKCYFPTYFLEDLLPSQ